VKQFVEKMKAWAKLGVERFNKLDTGDKIATSCLAGGTLGMVGGNAGEVDDTGVVNGPHRAVFMLGLVSTVLSAIYLFRKYVPSRKE